MATPRTILLERPEADGAESGARESSRLRLRALVWLPPFLLVVDYLLHMLLPNGQVSPVTGVYRFVLEVLFAAYAVAVAVSFARAGLRRRLNRFIPLFVALAALLGMWDTVTLKLDAIHLPYFPGPDKVLSVYPSEWQRLLLCVALSLRLLLTGYAIGAAVGFLTGTAIGWNARFNYWVNPVLKFIGPIPATAWIPIAMVVFPSSFWAGVFLIALATWFPMTVMTSSGIAGVKNSYFEVARTLGASRRFLILKVAIPAAYPLIFIGLFMGMGMSFVTLIVAEMLGVRAGIGFFITWAQGWAEYARVYAALILIALIFSTLLTLLFRIKDRVLIWQKGLIKW